MTHTLSLSPLFRHSVGFDRFNDLFETLLSDVKPATNYPPYDIVKTGDETYQIQMAVAGFKEADLSVSLENEQLIIKGQMEQNTEDRSDERQYLHHGIARREFEVAFRLADHMKVTQANLTDGMLSIGVEHEVPEDAKPRTIPIGHNKETVVLEHDIA